MSEPLNNTLVAYFSVTGNTRKLAENLAQVAHADLFEIVPKKPYTEEDCDWHNPESRTVWNAMTAALVRQLRPMYQIWISIGIFFSDFLSGGMRHPASLKLSWKVMIWKENSLFRSAHPAAVILGIVH